jgi:signal transduction histidine kinase
MTEMVSLSDSRAGLGVRVYRASRLPSADEFGVGYVAGVVLLAGLNYAAGRISNGPLAESNFAPIVFLPVGVGIAVLYVAGMRFWPGVLVGSLLTEFTAPDSSGQAFGFALGGFTEIVVATVLLRRFVRRTRPLDTVDGVAGMVAAIATGQAVGATIGCLTVRLNHVLSTSALPAFWRTWWLSGFCAGVLVVPIVLAWYPWPQHGLRRRPSWDVVLPLVAVVGSSALVFQTSRPLSYLVFPALMWTGLRLGQRGATVAVAIASGFAVWATAHFLGPFHSFDASSAVVNTQLFIVVAALTTLLLGALVSDRERLAVALRGSLLRIVETAESERLRLERDLHDGAQQRLMASQIKLSKAKDRAAAGEDLTAELSDIEVDAAGAAEELRALAHGIYPTVLRESGLGDALHSVAVTAPIRIEVHDEGIGRSSPAIEAAIYFCALEAIQNATKHAGPGARVEVNLTKRHKAIQFSITDDGIGTTTGALADGIGLVSMKDRVGSVGGRLDVVTAPGVGTRVEGTIPITQSA